MVKLSYLARYSNFAVCVWDLFCPFTVLLFLHADDVFSAFFSYSMIDVAMLNLSNQEIINIDHY